VSKRKTYQLTRRRVRRQEKQFTHDESATRDKTMGMACRRYYGTGIAVDNNPKNA
jgi:hypothetical protein